MLVADREEALRLKDATPGALAACDGEPQPGFDLSNSPAQLFDVDLGGRTVVQCTTAGTKGAVASRHSSPLLCTGFATARATADHLLATGVDEVCFVVTGGDEDRACAEHIAALLAGSEPDGRFVARARSSDAAADLLAGWAKGNRGVDQRDVEVCLEVDRFDFAMLAEVSGDRLLLRRGAPGR